MSLPSITKPRPTPDPNAMMNEILNVTKDHDPDCQCPWDRAFDALSELR